MSSGATALTRTRALRSVIVPYDFSTRCRAAARHALVLSRHYNAQLLFVHVIPFSNYEYASFEGGAYVGSDWPSEKEVREGLEAEIGALDAPAEERKSWQVNIFQGDPPEKIRRFVSRQESPIVVMPTHGYGAFRRFILGSVTTKILHDLDCPVLTGAHLDQVESFPAGGYARVACEVDLDEIGLPTVKWAHDFARSWKAELIVIHAVDWLEDSPADAAFYTPELRAQLLESARLKVADLLADAGFPDCALHLDLGARTKFIPEAVRECGADVLVVGRRPSHSAVGRMRSRAYDLIRAAPCAVASV